MIREASIYALKKLAPVEQVSYGLRVLTMRRWPRGIGWNEVDLWVPSAAPTADLLQAWQKHLLPFEAFLAQYRQEQQEQSSCQVRRFVRGCLDAQTYPCRSIDYLQQLERHRGTVTICCWEQEARCHRFALVQLLREGAQEEREGGCS